MKNDKLDLSKYLDKDRLIEICEKVCIYVRDRIAKAYHEKGLVTDDFAGECNRAVLLFDIYFYEELRKIHIENMKQLLFGDKGQFEGFEFIKYKYDIVNMHNVEKILMVNLYDDMNIKIDFVHGEQKHTKRINPFYWEVEHTWIKVTMGRIHVYADPTSGQFKYLYPEIPDYYVSTRKPKWFYPDSENPRWNQNIQK